MTPPLGRVVHRAQHLTKLRWPTPLLIVLACAGCGGLPRPRRAQVNAADYVAVPTPPKAPPVEIVPAEPPAPATSTGARVVWVDGAWTFDGDRYKWSAGAWVLAPEDARLARWVIVRRADDGQLFFAPSRWYGANGAPIDPPPQLARARTRIVEGE